MLVEIIVLAILIALSGFFSGAEIALFSLSDIKARKLLRERKRGARILIRLKSNPHRMLVTILIGNNVVNIGAAALATIVFTDIFGSTGVGLATGIMTFIVLVFGDHGMRLQGIVVDHRKGKMAFDDFIGLGKSLLHIPLFQMILVPDIAGSILVDLR